MKKSIFFKQNAPLLMLLSVFFGFFIFFVVRGVRSAPKAVPSREVVDAGASGRDQQLKKFNLTGFDSSGKVFWNLEGDTAKINPEQIVFLEQNVTLKMRDNTVIKTDHVQWSQDGGTLKTNAPVHVMHESVDVKGRGAIGKPQESFIQLNRDIVMLIQPKTRLVCDGPMKIFYDQNKMTFYRKVKVTDERGSLAANRMDVYFDGETKKVQQIVAVGQVVIERGADTTRSERAIYTLATGSVRLEGNPEITLHKNSTGILDGTFRS